MRRTLLLILSIVVTAAAQNPEERLKSLEQAGEQALARGDYSAAVGAYQSAARMFNEVTASPATTQRVVVRYAEVREIVGDYEDAERLSGQVISMAPGAEYLFRALLVQAGGKSFRGDFAGAQADLDSANRIAQRDNRLLPRLQSAIVESRLAAGKLAEAKAALQQMDAAQAGSAPESALLPARVALALGNYAEAESLLERSQGAVAGDPLQRLYWNVLKAELLASSQRLRAAGSLFAQACAQLTDSLGATRPAAAGCWAREGAAAYRMNPNADSAALLQKAETGLARYAANHPLAGERELAAGYEAVIQGDAASAGGHFEQARSIRAAVFGDGSTAVAEAEVALAEVDLRQNRIAQAQERTGKALAVLSAVSPQHTLRMRALLESAQCSAAAKKWSDAEAAIQDWRNNLAPAKEDSPDLAAALALQADAAWELRHDPAADALLADSIRIRRSLGGWTPAEAARLYGRLAEIRVALNKKWPFDTEPDLAPAARAELYQRIASSLETAGQPAEAAAAWTGVVDLRNQLGMPHDQDYLAALEKVAHLSELAGQSPVRMKTLGQILDLREKLGRGSTPDTLTMMEELAQFESSNRDFGAALPLWQRLADVGVDDVRPLVLERLADALQETGHPDDAARTCLRLARLDMLEGNLSAAESFAERARKIATTGASETAATAFQLIASIRSQQPEGQKPAEARSYLREILDSSSDPAIRALCFSGLARLDMKDDLDQADKDCTEAESQARGVQLPGVQATVLATRALLLAKRSRKDEALAKYDEFITAEAGMDPQRDFPLLTFLGEASRFYAPAQRFDRVEEIDRRRAAATATAFGKRSPETARALESWANTLSTLLKRFEDAKPLYDQALAIFEDRPDGKADAAAILAALGEMSRQQGKTADALRMYKLAMAQDPSQERLFLLPIAALQLSSGDAGGAVTSYSRLREISKPGDSQSHWIEAGSGLCAALNQAGQFKRADEELGRLRQAVRRANGNRDSVAEMNILVEVAKSMAMSRSKEAKNLENQAARMASNLKISR